jgi:hypothetical protein
MILNLDVNAWNPVATQRLDIPVVETDNLTDDNYKDALVNPDQDIRLTTAHNSFLWWLWKDGEDEQDFPTLNTVKVTFGW